MTAPDRAAARWASELAALHHALLDDAQAEGDALVRAADAEAAALERDAEAERQSLLARARAAGEAAADHEMAQLAERARHDTHRALLAAQLAVYEELRRAVTDAAVAQRHQPDYPELRDRLAARAVAQLGPQASVVEAPDGGIIATAGDRRVVYTLAALAERALATMAEEVSAQWRAT